MRHLTRGAAAILAVVAILTIGVSSVAAGNRATIESFSLDDRGTTRSPPAKSSGSTSPGSFGS